eukprot:TRINITY_DN8331_c0_g1_i1.p1 TRINITY_DN8331_c0_g1~~TRINITY_DN8331_c0_g1_i1.p1  ORF type:complete len:111 (-),score=19.33 TRINITY_DN8331_c0_g1_i1:177-509(-)
MRSASQTEAEKSVELPTERLMRLAELCRISVTDAEIPRVKNDLASILRFVEQVSHIHPEVKPLVNPVEAHPIKQRQDLVFQGGHQDEIMENAPQSFKQFIAVPKVRKEGL